MRFPPTLKRSRSVGVNYVEQEIRQGWKFRLRLREFLLGLFFVAHSVCLCIRNNRLLRLLLKFRNLAAKRFDDLRNNRIVDAGCFFE